MVMRSIDKHGELLVVCGLSGSGKSTLARHALSVFGEDLQYMNTITTRLRRQEEDDVEYTFTSDNEYDDIKSATLIWDESVIYGYRYGLNAADYIERMKQGKNFIVCSTPSNDIIDVMSTIYRREYMKSIHLLTDSELSQERMIRRDLELNVGRVAVDLAMSTRDFQADFSLQPSGSLERDKENFVEIVRGIIYE